MKRPELTDSDWDLIEYCLIVSLMDATANLEKKDLGDMEVTLHRNTLQKARTLLNKIQEV